MDTKEAYNLWSKQYDSNKNKTRDLEAKALRQTLAFYNFKDCLEIGCGTGKNTVWLLEKAEHITAVDLSDDMLNKAKEKINSQKVRFLTADITEAWNFTSNKFDLIVFSLVLEHIENLNHIFHQASAFLRPGGLIYVGELHPYKQYLGTKARFETEEGLQVLKCCTHNVSGFVQSAINNGLEINLMDEFFDEGDKTITPRLLTILLKKK
ncbi:MAG TPA: class I SAM-dependent methyltransferase [Ignavibacteriaceae bacterium]|nr:class I SAM-dependent methyltransferase [Ignavibacteriaceae bacterium]